MTATIVRPQPVVYDANTFPDAPSEAIRYFQQIEAAKGTQYATTLQAFAFLVDIVSMSVPDNMDELASSNMALVSDALGTSVEEVGQMIACVSADADATILRRQLLGRQH